ncbi:MAG: hypothetical protein K2P84_00585 [Undibacterium sp.]|nr:hypothetical protein [Undibacterium sp.]
MQKNLILSLSLLSILIGCGGNGNGNTKTAATPENKVTPAPLITSDFVALANSADCAQLNNRLFLIDQKQILWDKAGTCADASYQQTLYSGSVQNILCSKADSIAGPTNSCVDPANKAFFNTIITHLDKADLGLGSAHQVQQLLVTPKASTSLATTALDLSFYRGAGSGNLVIKDKTAWDQLLIISSPPARSPNMSLEETLKQKTFLSENTNFATRMVIATLFKTPNNCSTTQIVKISSDGQKLSADFIEQELISIASCDPSSSSTSTPMSVVETRKLDLPVEFNNVSRALISPSRIFKGNDASYEIGTRNVLIKDQAAWAKLWLEFNTRRTPTPELPLVDFTKNMIVGVFLGNRPSGCHDIADMRVWRAAGKLMLSHRDTEPAENAQYACTMAIVSPYYLIEIARSDEAVEYTPMRYLR